MGNARKNDVTFTTFSGVARLLVMPGPSYAVWFGIGQDQKKEEVATVANVLQQLHYTL